MATILNNPAKELGRIFSVIFALWLTSSLASAAGSTDDIRMLVEENTARLLAKLDQERGRYETDPEHFYQEMDKALSDIVAFKRIAARVMGKYARKASKEQRQRFLQVFKRSMYESYSKALVESRVAAMEVESVRLTPGSNDKATVIIKVTSGSGNQYDVAYSLFQDKSAQWLVENVVVNGINVGLAFRDRFEQAYRNNKGDINAVIAHWSSEISDDSSQVVANLD